MRQIREERVETFEDLLKEFKGLSPKQKEELQILYPLGLKLDGLTPRDWDDIDSSVVDPSSIWCPLCTFVVARGEEEFYKKAKEIKGYCVVNGSKISKIPFGERVKYVAWDPIEFVGFANRIIIINNKNLRYLEIMIEEDMAIYFKIDSILDVVSWVKMRKINKKSKEDLK